MHPCCIYPDTLPRLQSRLKTTCIKLILYQKLINVCTRQYITQHSIQSTSTTQPSCIHPDAIPRLHQFLYPSVHRVHLRPYPGTQPRLHLRHVRTHPVYTLTFKLDYIDSTKTSSKYVPVLYIKLYYT